MTSARSEGPRVARSEGAARIPSDLFVEVVRLLVVALLTAVGLEIGRRSDGVVDGSRAVLGATLGACLGYVYGGVTGRYLRRAMGSFEDKVERAPTAAIVVGVLGATACGAFGAFVGGAAVLVLPAPFGWPVFGLCTWLGLYAGFSIGARKGEDLLDLVQPRLGLGSFGETLAGPAEAQVGDGRRLVLVDSSAAIDGRLLDLARSGFLPGALAVPRFVLDELQGIADAADPTRRRRGQRGLELLESLRLDAGLGLAVLDDEVPERGEVDAKLIALGQRLGAAILTVDDALVRVAELQGVRCLAVHRLAEGLAPRLLPGDLVRLTVTKEGRDPGQGVGYLEDGTMVVVNDGAELVGEDTDVCIVSAVQTARGVLYFASQAA